MAAQCSQGVRWGLPREHGPCSLLHLWLNLFKTWFPHVTGLTNRTHLGRELVTSAASDGCCEREAGWGVSVGPACSWCWFCPGAKGRPQGGCHTRKGQHGPHPAPRWGSPCSGLLFVGFSLGGVSSDCCRGGVGHVCGCYSCCCCCYNRGQRGLSVPLLT